MTTIKDIAARLELSPSTVSIVLKGNGDRRKIKKETQQRILETAMELGYKPNIQAKILRGSLSAKYNISLYWVSDNQISESEMERPVSVIVEDTMRGGYLGALTLCDLHPLPDCLFCTSDSIALGALKAFYEKGIRIPDQIEIISVGNGRPEQEEYCVPSLSVVSLPLEDMARECLKILSDSLSTFQYIPKSIAFPTPYIARESCPALQENLL